MNCYGPMKLIPLIGSWFSINNSTKEFVFDFDADKNDKQNSGV